MGFTIYKLFYDHYKHEVINISKKNCYMYNLIDVKSKSSSPRMAFFHNRYLKPMQHIYVLKEINHKSYHIDIDTY